MAHTCNCTNQCPGCGSCCQIACGCQRRGFTYPAPNTPYTPPPAPPRAIQPVPFQPGSIRLVTHEPLTAEQVREIIREEIGKALGELREPKGGDGA